ncbi:MAG: type I-U CRISPR-associated protein Cas5/Cas6 [Alicyclobacillus sp.]|nr:type I-U CRISPR-associated protein Cas5/Cas6 [Alicyclobacillus sp.]
MIGIELRFPAGDYHATPWGRHVNEAEVEWPPSPWRLLRSLLSCWYRHALYEAYPESLLRESLHLLATELPSYALPAAVHTHTRHYMPLGGNKKTLVFDGFLRISQNARMGVYWPHLSATREQWQLLTDLVGRLGYLGRAESWVQAEVVHERRLDINCTLAGTEEELSVHSTHPLESVYVLAPYTPQQYAAWRMEQEQGAAAQSSAGLRGRGRRQAHSTSVLPRDLLDALRVDTNDLQRERRNMPAGARWVIYQRPPLHHAQPVPQRRSRVSVKQPERMETPVGLDTPGQQMRPAQDKVMELGHGVREAPGVWRKTTGPVNTARLALTSRVLPRWSEVLDVSEVMHLALLYRSGEQEQAPWLVSGREPDGRVSERGHEHLFILPEDADGDGRIDHVLLHAAEPFPPALMQALPGLRRLHTPAWWPGPARNWAVYLEGWMHAPAPAEWTADTFSNRVQTACQTPAANLNASLLLQEGQIWISRTPYLHPWHVKRNGKFGAEEQIRRELRLRGFPEPVQIALLPAIEVNGSLWYPQRFRKLRYGKGQRLPDMRGGFWQLEFAAPVRGPICLGANCHFGMGMFAPAR